MRKRVRPAAAGLALAALVGAIATAPALGGGFNFGYRMHPRFFVAAAVLGLVTVAAGAGALRVHGIRSLGIGLGAPLALIGVTFGIMVALIAYSGPTPSEVAARQAALYDEVPVFPGATRGPIVADEMPPSGDLLEVGYLNQPTCCETSRTDTLRAERPVAEVERFYRRAAASRGWRVRRFGGGRDQSVQLIGRRGRALLIVDVEPRGGFPPVAMVRVLPTGNEGCHSRHDVGCW